MAPLFAPLAHPLFRRFLLGQSVSRAGDFVFFVALPWQVVLLGGSESEIGLVFGAFLGAQLVLTLAGGVLVDRVSRKRVVVLSDALQAVMVGLAAALALGGAMTVGALIVLAVAWGAAQAVAFPALGAFLPETVPKDELQGANSLYQGATLGAAMAGSALAGLLLLAFGPWSAFAFDAGTFALSAVLLGTLPTPARAARPAGAGSVLSEARAGWAYVARIPWLWIAIAIFAVVNAAEASPRSVVLPVLVGVDLKGGPAAVAAVAASFQGGWLLGSILPALRRPFRRPGLIAYAAALVSGAVLVLVGLSTSALEIAALLLVQGVAFGVFGVIWSTSIASYVDESFRGRVISIDTLGSISLLPLSAALVGAAAARVGAASLFLGGGLVVLVCAAVGLLYPPANRFGPPPELNEAGAPAAAGAPAPPPPR